MAPHPSNHGCCTRQAVFFLLLSTTTAALAAVVPTSYSSHCSSPPPAPDRHTDADDVELLGSFHLQPSTGFLSGRGADSLFSPDSDGLHGRSFSFLPLGFSRTSDPALLHLTATLTLLGYRVENVDGRPEISYWRNHSISFNLDGYYSSTTSELCMVGTGTEAADASSVPADGLLSMVGRRSMDSDQTLLMTVRFTSFGEPQGFGHGKARISSLRDSTDDLYFKTRDITLFGIGNQQQQQQVSEPIWSWRKEPKSIVTAASTTLFCVFTFLQILVHARRDQREPPSMAMLVAIPLGCVVLDLILSHWVLLLVTFVYMFS